MQQIKNRYKAESMFCELFVKAGRALGVPPYGEDDRGDKHKLNSDTIDVIHECEFEDPHFIGGPGAFNFAKSRESINRIFERAEPVAVEVCAALETLDPARAQEFRMRLDEIRNWMLRTAD